MTVRIGPLTDDALDEETRAVLEPLGERGNNHFFRTLARHPRIMKRWAGYGHVLLTGSLPERDRELLVLRAAYRGTSPYVWAHHQALAEAAGLTPDEVARVRLGWEADGWSEEDRIVLRAADELLDDHTVSDATWKDLSRRYDEEQLIEFPFVAAVYFSMGFALNSFGTELE